MCAKFVEMGGFLKLININPLEEMSTEDFEAAYALCIGVLVAIFIGSLVILIVICRRSKLYQYPKCKRHDDIRFAPDVHLIDPDKSEVELDEVCLRPEIDGILSDDQWVDDATGLAPHCIAILKIVRTLTGLLTTFAMGPISSKSPAHNCKLNTDIIDIARRISVRVDDVVRAMYPPLDARLLEARAAALTAATTQLVLIVRFNTTTNNRGSLAGVDDKLTELDSHLMVLREAALTQEASSRIDDVINRTTSTFV